MTEKSGEIQVFGAEKYFNRKVTEIPRASTKYQVEYGTPSISSLTTWNSQNALLKRDSQKTIKDKVHAKSVLSRLGLKCYCSDKNSVDISDHAGEIYGAVHGKTTPKKVLNLEENIPRKSLQVFGSPNPILTNNKRSSLSFDKRLIFPSKMEEIVEANYDDDDDDDLFEIESLKEKSSNNFLSRQTSDSASSCVSPTHYASSEASVEWNVVDCEDQMSEFIVRSPGMLLGCKSHRVLRVADAFITYEKQSLSPKIGNNRKQCYFSNGNIFERD